jgi:hypothetical protein
MTLTKFLFLRISRIRIRIDPHSFSKLDPDLHSPKKLASDPHKGNADPRPLCSDSPNRANIKKAIVFF